MARRLEGLELKKKSKPKAGKRKKKKAVDKKKTKSIKKPVALDYFAADYM